MMDVKLNADRTATVARCCTNRRFSQSSLRSEVAAIAKPRTHYASAGTGVLRRAGLPLAVSLGSRSA